MSYSGIQTVKVVSPYWWRSDRTGSVYHKDNHTTENDVPSDVPTKGVFALHTKQHYRSTYAVGYSTVSTAVKSQGHEPIAGYSGFKAGVVAGNIIGKTHHDGLVAAKTHLMQTSQAMFPKAEVENQ